MVIRPLVYQDRSEILRLIEGTGTFNEMEIQVAAEVIDDALRHPEKSDYNIFSAVDASDSPNGYICFGPIPMTQDRYDLYWIAVDKTASRQGVGGKLLKFMEANLLKKGAGRVYVDTSSTPPYKAARAFYGKHGYRLVCVLDDFYRKGDHKMIFMKEL
ncbi:MAG: GNAT family N-acetyltransferase [Desulfobacterales bacterium]|nr:GNAT family N-acetyltransferase [Desulfobacterales bacterium]